VPANDPAAWAIRLRAARRGRAWSVAEMARQLREGAGQRRHQLPGIESLRREITDWEQGKHKPGEAYRLLYAHVLGIDEEALFGDETDEPKVFVPQSEAAAFPLAVWPSFLALNPDAEERLKATIAAPRRADAETVRIFDQILDSCVIGGRNMPPPDLASILTPIFNVIGQFRRDAKAPIRRGLLDVASRYAQLIGRMHYEAADLTAALTWSDRALLAAHEAGNEQLVSYTLARRASLAGAQGDGTQVVDLATTARERVRLPAHIASMACRHEAQGHAMLGDADTCQHRLDDAAELLLSDHEDTDTPYASGFSLGFHMVQMAGCFTELGQSAQAAEIYERELPTLKNPSRELAYNMARLAHAYIDLGERQCATEISRDAEQIARSTGAARAVLELRRVRHETARWWD
jgi:transcriptional regulator with XRE-family HTH domain